MCVYASGVSRGQITNLRRSFSATSAARISKLSAIEWAILPSVFIEQGRTNLARALTTGSTGPDFIADFYFDAVYVRPMPMYSLPGLIDHH